MTDVEGLLVVLPHVGLTSVSIFFDAVTAARTRHGFEPTVFGHDIVSVAEAVSVIAEPISRPPLVHQFQVTPYSLGVAVGKGIAPRDVYRFLLHHARCVWPTAICGLDDDTEAALAEDPIYRFLATCMNSYGKVRLVVGEHGCFVECVSAELAAQLRRDPVIASQCRSPADAPSSLPEASVPTAMLDDDDDGNEAFVGHSQGRSRFELVDTAACKFVAERCLSTFGLPIAQQYAHETDTSLPLLHLALRTSTKPREYQRRAVEAAVGDAQGQGRQQTSYANSGIVVLPCGAGKTLVGIMLMCAINRPTVILCASSVSVEQWRNQVLDFAAFDQQAETRSVEAPSLAVASGKASAAGPASVGRTLADRIATRIACFTGRQKDRVTQYTRIIITTYSMLSVAHRSFTQQHDATEATGGRGAGSTRSRTAAVQKSRAVSDALFRPAGWGLVLLDEVHVVPANFFREALASLRAKCTVGLTATFVREDSKILHLHHLVGPKLFDVSWETLKAQGYLADVTCVEVHCPMAYEFGVEYWVRSGRRGITGNFSAAMPDDGKSRPAPATVPLLVALAAANPMKLACTLDLVQRHRGAKIILFCDYIDQLKRYAEVLGCPMVHGETPHPDRLKTFSDFECTGRLNVIAVSRVGDVSVNLPSASVVIQVSSHGGSRRQEAQRLGRILRPKSRNADGTSVHAYFYSLVSDDTLETRYASHRTAFLVEQGYSCRIETYHPPAVSNGGGTDPSSGSGSQAVLDEPRRLAWLARVVAQWELASAPSAGSGYHRGDEDVEDINGEGSDGAGGGLRRRGLLRSGGAADPGLLYSTSSSDAEESADGSKITTVKQENDAVAGRKRETSTRASARQAPPRPRSRVDTVSLAATTTAQDDVVYHEFA